MGKTVLRIEDNEQNRYLITYILEKGGYRVVQATNGPEGIRQALQEIPDLILLDIQLPGMDGYAVLQELRNQPALREVSVVAVTSYAMVGDRERALAAGCNGYIEKPIKPDTFVVDVARYLNETRAKERREQ